jgi:hypothetical protein
VHLRRDGDDAARRYSEQARQMVEMGQTRKDPP